MTSDSHLRRTFNILALCLLLACCLPLAGCGAFYFSQPYSFDEMSQQLHDSGEVDVPFSQADEEVFRDRPRIVGYTCQVDGRDLQFHCISGVYADHLFYIPMGWFREVDTDYTDTIMGLYKDQADAAGIQVGVGLESHNPYITTSPGGSVKWDDFYIHSRADIPQAAAAICAMDAVYAPEAQYHDGRWLDEPRKMFIYLEIPISGGDEDDFYELGMNGVALDGVNGAPLDEPTLTAQIQAEYQSYEDGTAHNFYASNYNLSDAQVAQLFAQADDAAEEG